MIKQLVCVSLVLLGLNACRNPLKDQMRGNRQDQGAPATRIDRDIPYPKIFSLYDGVRRALAADNFADVSKLAADLGDEVRSMSKDTAAGQKELHSISLAALEVSRQTEKDRIREAFGLLSKAIVDFYKGKTSTKMILYHCPMVKGYAYWLQTRESPISNPYMGLKMQKCGTAQDF